MLEVDKQLQAAQAEELARHAQASKRAASDDGMGLYWRMMRTSDAEAFMKSLPPDQQEALRAVMHSKAAHAENGMDLYWRMMRSTDAEGFVQSLPPEQQEALQAAVQEKQNEQVH